MDPSKTTHTLTVAETLKNNPIGKLQEMHILNDEDIGAPPFYNLIETKGDDHGPIFTIEALYRGQTATGTGPSKQLAKTYAAANLLSKLIGEEEAKSSITLDLSQICISENSVGNLQELCCVKGLEHPWYEEISAIGPAHNRNFSMTCSIGSICERGTGPNKKTAKRECAARVYARLIKMTPQQLKEFEDPEIQEKRKEKAAELEREEKEEEEKRRKEIEAGSLVVDWNMDTWKQTNIQTKDVITQKENNERLEKNKIFIESDRKETELKEESKAFKSNGFDDGLDSVEPAGQGWESGEPMYEGDPGTWGNNVNTNGEVLEGDGVDKQVLKEMQDLISKSKADLAEK